MKKRYKKYLFARGKHIALAVTSVMLVLLLGVAYLWARADEETIHIFPAKVTAEGWEQAPAALDQELSGAALFEDFNEDNSAFLVFPPTKREKPLILQEREEGAANTTPERRAKSDGEVQENAEGERIEVPAEPSGETAGGEVSESGETQKADVSNGTAAATTTSPAPTTPTIASTTDAAVRAAISLKSWSALARRALMRLSTPVVRAQVVDESAPQEATTTAGAEEEADTVPQEDAPAAFSPVQDEEAPATGGVVQGDEVPEEVAADGNLAAAHVEENEKKAISSGGTTVEALGNAEAATGTAPSAAASSTEELAPGGKEGRGEQAGAPLPQAAKEQAGENSLATAAEDEGPVTVCAIRGTACRVIEFSGFSIGGALPKESLRGMQLRLSFAAMVNGVPFEDDKVLVRYRLGGKWYVAGEIGIRNTVSNARNGGHFLFALPELTSWDEIDDLVVQLEVVRNSNLFAKVYLDGVWLDATYAVPQDVPEDIEDIASRAENAGRVKTELAAREESAFPDILREKDRRIEFSYTDDLEGENLIIKSDRATYFGLTKAKVYFSVTNDSERQDDVLLQVHLPRDKGVVTSLKRFVKNAPRQVVVPEYAPTAFLCETPWAEYTSPEDLIPRGEQKGMLEPLRRAGKKEVSPEDTAAPSSAGAQALPASEGGASVERTAPEEESAVSATEEGVGADISGASASGNTDTTDTNAQAPPDASGTQGGEEAAQENAAPDTAAPAPSAVEDSGEPVALLGGNTARTVRVAAFSEEEGEAAANGAVSEETAASAAPVAAVDASTPAAEEARALPPAGNEAAEAPGADAPLAGRESEQDLPETEGVLETVGSSAAVTATSASEREKEAGTSTEKRDAAAPATRPIDTLDFDRASLGEVLEALEDTQARESAAATETTASTSGRFFCPATREVRWCDSLNADGTNCVTNRTKVGERVDTLLEDTWVPLPTAGGETKVDFTRFQKLAQLFGGGLQRKAVPSRYIVKTSTEEPQRIAAGQTVYYEMTVEYPVGTVGEFWIEAIGRKGSYGLLDPWWNGNWQYRIPIEIDNTGNSNTLTEYQVYLELDSMLTDFWNGVNSDGSDIRFLSQTEDTYSNWYDNAWQHRIPLTIQASQVDGDLTDFPVYVDLADLGSHLFQNATTSGGDIRVTTADGKTEVPRELVSFDGTTQTGELYFKAPQISSTTDTVFYLYYGNANAADYASSSAYGSQKVWTNNYRAVYHLDAAATSTDSTGNGYTGAPSNLLATSTAKLGTAVGFNGTNSYMDLVNDMGITGSDFSVSFWINYQGTSRFCPVCKNDNTGNNEFLIFYERNGGENNFDLYVENVNVLNNTSAVLGTNRWHQITVDHDGTALSIFQDGVFKNEATTSAPVFDLTGRAWSMGQEWDGGSRSDFFLGALDEVRISDVARTGSWLTAEFRNQSTSTQFYATSTVETQSPATATELDHWVQYFDKTASSARIWVQVDQIPANATSTIYLYYGNASASSASDPFAPFTYSTLRDLYYVTRNDFAGGDVIAVYSLIDNNVVQLDNGATTTLNKGQGTTYSSFTAASVVRAKGPVDAHLDYAGNDDGDSLVPISFASTTFVFGPRNAGTEVFHLYSPFGSSTVRIYNGGAGTPGIDTAIATSTQSSQTLGISNGNAAIVDAEIPVLLGFDRGGDGLAVYPATTRDLYGIRSDSQYVGVGVSGTNFDIACSGGGSLSVTGQARGNRYSNTTCGNGGNGTGNAVRLYNINNPVGGTQSADGDGTDASMFWPYKEFATEYMVPVNTSYIAIVCAPEDGTVNLSLYDSSGVEVSTATCAGSGNAPGKAYFGNDDTINYTPGYYVASTDSPPKPFYAYFEDHTDAGSGSNGGDEVNFTAAPQARQLSYPHPRIASYGAQETSNIPSFSLAAFQWYANVNALTPTDAWPAGAEDITENTPISATEAVTGGDALRLRFALKVNNATTTPLNDAFTLQYASTTIGSACNVGTLAWQNVGNIGSTTAKWRGLDNAALADGAALATTTLSIATEKATYEEENNTALLTGAYGPGSVIEFDWALDATNVDTNTSYCFRVAGVGGTAIAAPLVYPQADTNSAPSSPTLIVPFDNSKESDLTPSLTFSANDAAGDDLDYQVQIDDNYDFSSPVVDVDSDTSPLQFANVVNPADKAPFTAGQTVRFTVPSDLASSTTFYWRVRAIDPSGSNQYSVWSSPPRSFTTDQTVTVSTWFQTMQEQFETDSLIGLFASTSDDVRLGGPIGEWGTVIVTDENYEVVTTQRTYDNPVVVASVRYDGTNVPARTARVRNKSATSFEIKAAGSASTTLVTGTTTVDYLVLEAGDHTIDDGTASGRRVVAGSRKNVSGVYCRSNFLEGAASVVTFSPAFASAPAVLHTVVSDQDPSWVTTSAYDGSNMGNPPNTTTAALMLQRVYDVAVDDCAHDPEDIDYVAFTVGHATLASGLEYDAQVSGNAVSGPNESAIAWVSPFSSTPQTYVVSMGGVNGGDGGFALTDTGTAVTVTDWYGTIDEDGAGADRSHTQEQVGLVGFETATGTLTALFKGTIAGTAVDFDDAVIGNKWGSASWNDSQPAGTSITYQVQYYNGGWLPVPNTDLPGNEAGTTTGPVDLSGLDTQTYNQLRLFATLQSSTTSATPILYDWTISWNQGVFTPTTTVPFDNERVASTTTVFQFTTDDPEGDDLVYEIQIADDIGFTSNVRTFASDNDPGTAFTNVSTPLDTSPFNSGDTIQFTATSGTNLLDGNTYWWRVRAKDPAGDNVFSLWSPEQSFSIASSVTVSTWYQTTNDQFLRGTLQGVTVNNGDMEIQTTIGEYGTVDVNGSAWTTVNLNNTFSDLVVVGSARYAPDTDRQRSVRVRNKTTTSFQIKVDNANGTTDPVGTTTVDWVAMEAGSWVMENSAGGVKVIAATVQDVTQVQNNTYSNSKEWTTVTFSPSFSAAPAVLATVASENAGTWVATHINDGTSVGKEPTASQMGVALGRSLQSAPALSEDIDYIALDTGHGTSSDGGEFDAAIALNAVNCCNGAAGTAVSYTTPFPTAPAVTVLQQMGENGGNGSWAERHTSPASTASVVYASVDEENGDTGSRTHTTETVSVLAFENATGTVRRVGGALTGTSSSQTIDFYDGSGPKWGTASWSVTTPGTSTLRMQVLYATGTSYELIPDSDLPGNSTGTTTSPLDLGDLDFQKYNKIRLRAVFTCTGSGACPSLHDWQVTWSEGIRVKGTAYAYDQTTPLTSGTVRLALDGVLQANTGTIQPDGTWTINNVNAFPNDVVTVFIENAATSGRATAVTLYDGTGDVTNMLLAERHVALGSGDNPTLTNVDLAVYDNSVAGSDDIFYDVDAGNDFSLCVVSAGCADAELVVLSGTTYRPDSAGSGNVTVHDLEIDGSVIADGNTLYVGGSWDNNGGFQADASSVVFTATSGTETIDSTGAATSSFNSVTFGQGTGTASFVLGSDLDIDGPATISFGTLTASSANLTLAGNLTIGASGAFAKGSGTTTFDGTGNATWKDNTNPKQDMGVVEISGSGKTVETTSDVRVTDITIRSGATLDATTLNSLVEVRGNWRNEGTFTARNGEVRFTATTSGHIIDPGGSSFYNLTFNGNGGNWAFVQPQVTAQNDFVITAGVVTLPSATTTVGNSFLNNGGSFAHNNGAVYLTASDSGNQVRASSSDFYILWFNSPTGVWDMLDTAATTSSHFMVQQGSVTLPSGTLTVGGDFTIDAGSFSHNNGEVILRTFGNPRSVRANGSDFYRMRFRGSGSSGAAWYNAAWSYRTPVSIQASQVDADLTDFPVYLDLSVLGSNFFTRARSDGGDIRITTDDGVTEVPRELVSFATSTQSGEVHFLAPSISSSTNTTFYVYYGNASAADYPDTDPYGAEAVWTNNYLAVYHLEEDAAGAGGSVIYLDSTANGYDGLDYLVSTGKSGVVGRGQQFVGTSNEYLELPNTVLTGRNDVTVSYWMKTTRTAAQAIVSAATAANDNEYLIYYPNNTSVNLYTGESPTTNVQWGIANAADNNWHLVVFERRGSSNQANLFIDGFADNENPKTTTLNTLTVDAGGLYVGQEQDSVGDCCNSAQAFDGYLDELRFASTTRSAAWYDAEYANQIAPTTFFGTSSSELLPGRSFTELSATSTSDVVIESGLVNLPTNTFAVGGGFANSGIFNPSTGAVRFFASTTGHAIDAGGSSFYDVIFNGTGGGWTVTAHATATNEWRIEAASSFAVSSGVTVEVDGQFTNAVGGSATNWTGSILYLNSGTGYTVGGKSLPTETYGTLRLGTGTHVRLWNASAATTTVATSASLYSQDHAGVDGDLYLWGDYTRTSGTDYWSYAKDFDGTALSGGATRAVDVRFASGTRAQIQSGASLEIVGAASATTTLRNQGSGRYALVLSGGTLTAQYASFTDTDQNGLQLLASTTVSALYPVDFVLNENGGTSLTLEDTTIDANSEYQLFGVSFATGTGVTSGFNVTASGTPASYWWFRDTYGSFAGEAYDNDPGGDPGNVRWDDSSYLISVSGKVYASDRTGVGSVCDGASAVVRLVVSGGASYDTSCSAADGSYTLTNVAYNGDATLTLFLNGTSSHGAVVSRTPIGNVSGLDLYEGHVLVRHEDTAPLTLTQMALYDKDDDPDIPFMATATAVLTVDPETALGVWPGKTFDPQGDLTLLSGGSGAAHDGTLYLFGTSTLTLSVGNALSVGGSWIADSGSTFTAANGLVQFTATTSGKRIVAQSPFYDVSLTGSGGEWDVDVTDMTVAHNLAITAGTLTGTSSITVQQGTLEGNGTIFMLGGTVSVDTSGTFGGNSNWTFSDLTLGDGTTVGSTTKTGTGDIRINGTLRVMANHTLNAGAVQWTLAGAGNAFIMAGTFVPDTSTTTFAGSVAMTVAPLSYYDLVLAPEGGAPTYTLAAGGITVNRNLTVGGGGVSLTATADTNDPLVDITGDFTIATSATYVAAGSNDVRIAGSYYNFGTLTAPAGSSVVFDSADGGEVVEPGASAFAGVLFTNGGGWNIIGNATATQNWTIASAASYTHASGTRLVVEGTFSNQVGGASTTWSGTTLVLRSGSDYSVNTKTGGADSYDTLVVENGTIVRLWNSAAGSYQIATDSALYSQDHAGVDGDLYIWGAYTRTSGNDYWSYAKDFDGTALSTSTARQANVYFAAGATTTFAGGTLEIVGTGTASTTLQNQGVGTYALTVGNGSTFTATHYVVRDIESGGLVLTGAPTVSDLSDGDFLLDAAGGSMMTVGGSVIDANPLKTFRRLRFATSTGVGSGFNITATGTSISSWRFPSATGALAGEAYDSDPGGNPGYLIWDDSDANITISGTVYSDEGTTPIGGAVCDGTTPVVRLVVAGVSLQTTSCSAASSTYAFTNVGFTAGDSVLVYLDTNGGARAANVTVDPVTNITDMDLYQDRTIVRHEDTNPITIDAMALYDSDQDPDVPFNAQTGTPDTLTTPAGTELIVWSGKEFAPGGNITLNSGGTGGARDGTLHLFANAKFTATGTESHSIGGSLRRASAASLAAASSTITFTATTTGKVVELGGSSLHHLVFSGSGGSWVFSDTAATTTGDITISAGAVTFPTSSLAVGGSFSNTGGSFTATSGVWTFTSATSEVVRAGGSDLPALIFSGGGTWSFQDSAATTTGAVTVASGAVAFPPVSFAVGGSYTISGTATSSSLTVFNGSAPGQVIALGANTLASTTFRGTGSWTFTDTNATTSGNLVIENGSVTAPSGTLAVGASFENKTASSTAFNAGAGTLRFSGSTAGNTIAPGGALLGAVVVDSAAGGWTLTESATTTGDFSLFNAASFTVASGTTLEVGGVFTNTVGGAATAFDGATLYLNAADLSFAVNGKTHTGDAYDILLVGSTTKAYVWNSRATTTTVATTGLFYSQDHAGVDGNLYLWGTYTRASGGEYWDYAKDFDGTALTGAARRAVSVRIASGSILTFTGGTLELLGAQGATTSVAAQSGTFTWEVNGGTLDAQYYSVRNTSAQGLALRGAPTISDLSYGDFELGVNGGSLLTVASTTFDANPTKVFSQIRFATSTGIATGINVTVEGTTANFWSLVNEYGSLAGEAFDNDGSDACGAVRWTDSTCLEVSQAHFRFRADDGGEGVPADEWYSASWSKRKRVTVINNTSVALTDQPVKLTVTYDTDMQADFDDLRFTDSGGTTSIPYWIERKNASTDAVVWVKVPSVPQNGSAAIFMYYGNTFAASAASGSAVFLHFDDFEDNDLDEYSGTDKTLFETSTGFNWDGTRGLDAAPGSENGQTANGGITWGAGGTLTATGTTLRFLQYVDATQDDEPCVLFGVQTTTTNNYAVCLDQFPNDFLSVAKNVTYSDDSGTILATSTITYGTIWYEVEVDWRTGGVIDVTVKNATSGAVVATTSVTDTTYAAGGTGFTFWAQHGGWDTISVRPYISQEPSFTFGPEQVNGGASWTAAQDATLLSQRAEQNFRVRISVENTGPQITNQQFRLQYASKGTSGTCEAVPGVNFQDVPVVASCGASPVCMTASPQFADQSATAQLLETSSGVTFIPGYMVEDPSNQGSAMTLNNNEFTEMEYSIEFTANALDSSYCLRVTDGGTELDSYPRVPEVRVTHPPKITAWSLNNDQNIALTEGTTTLVLATGTVQDLNGYADLLYATSTLYRSGLASSTFCTDDPNNCYQLSTSSCTLTNCSGTTCDISCSADLYYFAEPTDTGVYAAEDWRAFVTVPDTTGELGTSTSVGVELYTLRALDITTGEINFGTLNVGSDTGSFNATSTLENTGNIPIDVDLSGTDLSAQGSSIPVGNLKYASSTFSYSSCAICNFLSGTSTAFEVDLPKPTATSSVVTDEIYWGIAVPANTSGLTHYGTNYFIAIND